MPPIIPIHIDTSHTTSTHHVHYNDHNHYVNAGGGDPHHVTHMTAFAPIMVSKAAIASKASIAAMGGYSSSGGFHVNGGGCITTDHSQACASGAYNHGWNATIGGSVSTSPHVSIGGHVSGGPHGVHGGGIVVTGRW